MRPSFGFVIRAVAAEQPTVTRLAAMLGTSKQAASRLADDVVALGYPERAADADDWRRTRLALSARGERIRARARKESEAMEDELRRRFGGDDIGALRRLLVDFVERHGGADELAAQRSRVPEEQT
jgi:DNA-binding MarR family transcriptional regulator